MNGNNDLNAHAVFGDTNRADSVPDRLAPSSGPVYLEGRLVLSLSFQGEGAHARMVANGDEPIECYRLWDDISDTWYDDVLACGHEAGQCAIEAACSRADARYSVAEADRANAQPRCDLADNRAGAERNSGLMVLRFEQVDLVVRAGSRASASNAEGEAFLYSSNAEEGGASPFFTAQVALAAIARDNPVVLWEGALNVRARVVPEPDLDEEGMDANRSCDLRWKRIR